MAPDISILNNFLPLFVFVLIFVFLYAILEKTKLLGDSSRFNFLVSLCIAVMSMFSGSSTELILAVLPWYIFLMFFLLLLFTLFMFFGVDAKDVWPKVGGQTTVFIVMIIALIVSITKVFGPVFTPYAVEGTSNVFRTIFHPRVVGAFFILLIASLLIKNISENV